MQNTVATEPKSLFGKWESNNQKHFEIVPGKTNDLTVAVFPNVNDLSASFFDEEEAIVLFGVDKQREMGRALDNFLSQITKGSSPVLFELFGKLQKGIKETNIGELEQTIREAQNKAWYHGIMDAVGLSSVAKRLERGSEKISGLLTSKSKSLLDLTQKMESDLNKSVLTLISDSKTMANLAEEYRKHVDELEKVVEFGKNILKNAKIVEQQKIATSTSSGDSLEIEQAKIFSQKVSLLESRILDLEIVVKSVPADLEAIRLSQGASFQTIAATASGATTEFNTIKGTLIRLSVAHNIQSMQTLNEERRKLRDSLQSHSADLLGKVAIEAAQTSARNKMEDATKLLDFATKISSISDRVIEEGKQNKLRFEEARQKLGQVKLLIDKQ